MSLSFVLLLAAVLPAYGLHGGQPASGPEFAPYVILRKTDGRRNFLNDQPCSGTLISPRWVLTAAHCVFDIRDRITVTVPGSGALPPWSSDSHWDVSGERFVRQRWLIPSLPAVNDEFDSDVGLILLERPVPAGRVAGFPVVASPRDVEAAPAAGGLAVVGYGLSTECGSGSPWLGDGGAGRARFGESRVEFIRSHGGQRLRTLLREAPGSPACMNHGDSGGPLLEWRGRKVLGVVSRPDTVVTAPPSLAFVPTGRGVFATVTPYWCDFFHEVARRSTDAGAELLATVPWCVRR